MVFGDENILLGLHLNSDTATDALIEMDEHADKHAEALAMKYTLTWNFCPIESCFIKMIL